MFVHEKEMGLRKLFTVQQK